MIEDGGDAPDEQLKQKHNGVAAATVVHPKEKFGEVFADRKPHRPDRWPASRKDAADAPGRDERCWPDEKFCVFVARSCCAAICSES